MDMLTLRSSIDYWTFNPSQSRLIWSFYPVFLIVFNLGFAAALVQYDPFRSWWFSMWFGGVFGEGDFDLLWMISETKIRWHIYDSPFNTRLDLSKPLLQSWKSILDRGVVQLLCHLPHFALLIFIYLFSDPF